MNFKVSSGGIGNINTYKGVNNNTLRREFINQEYEQDDPNIYNNTADNTEIQYTQTSSYNDNIDETEVDYNALQNQNFAMAEYYDEQILELKEKYLSNLKECNDIYNDLAKLYDDDLYSNATNNTQEAYDSTLQSWLNNNSERWLELTETNILENWDENNFTILSCVQMSYNQYKEKCIKDISYIEQLRDIVLEEAYNCYSYFDNFEEYSKNEQYLSNIEEYKSNIEECDEILRNFNTYYDNVLYFCLYDNDINAYDSALNNWLDNYGQRWFELIGTNILENWDNNRLTIKKCVENNWIIVTNRNKYGPNSPAYDYMTEAEKNIAAYLYNTGNIDSYIEYFKFMEKIAIEREGQALANEFISSIKGKKWPEVCSLLIDEGFTDGLNQWWNGICNLLNADGIISAEEYKIGFILQYLEATYDSNVYDDIYNITSSIGNMAPSILTSTLVSAVFTPVVGSIVGATLMGTSAAGNARESALQSGMTEIQALTYAILTGVSEACLEKLLGGIPGISAVNKGFFGNILSEGLEEFSQTILDAIFITLVTGEPLAIDMNEAIKSGIYGMVTAGILNGGIMVINYNAKCNLNVLPKEKRDAVIAAINTEFAGLDMTNKENQQNLMDTLRAYGLTIEEISLNPDTNTDIKTETPSRDIIELSKIKDPLIIEDGINNGTITKSQIHNLFNNLVSNTFGSLNLSDDVATRLYIDLLQVAKNTGLEISTVQETGSLLHSMIDVTTLFSKLDGNNFVLEQLPTGAKKIEILDKQLKDGINSLLKNVTSQYNLDINLDMICDIVVKMNPSLIEDISTNKQALINNFQSFLFNFTSIDTQSLKDASHITDVAVNLGFKLADISLISIDGNIDGNKVNVLAGKMDNFKTRVIYKYNEYLITKNIYKMLSHGKSIYEVTAYASTARNSVRVISQTIMADYIDPKLKQGTNGWNVNYKTSFLNKLFKSSPDLQIKFVEYMNNHGICTGSQEFADISYEVKQSLRSDPKMLTAVENFYSTIIGSDGTSIDTNVVSNELVENAWLNVLDGSVKANDNVDSILGLDKFQNQNVFEKAKTIYDFLKISDLSEVKDFVNNGKISKNIIKDILTNLFGNQLGKWEISDDDAYNLYLDLLDNCNKAGKKITDIANLIGNKFENITNVKEFEFLCKEILGYDASTIDDYYKVIEENAKWDAKKIYDRKDYQKIVTLILDGKINLDDIGIPMELEDFKALSKKLQLDKVAALKETKVKDTIIKEDLIVKRKAAAQTALQIKVNAFSGDDVYESRYTSNKILSLIVDARKDKYSIKYKKIEINGIDYTKYFPKCDELQSNKRVKKYTMELLKLTSAELQEFAKINGIEYKVENEFEILAQYLKDNYGKIKIDGLIFQNAKSGESNFVTYGGNVGDTSQIVTYTLDGINYLTEKLTPVYAYYDKDGNITQNPSEAKFKDLLHYTKGYDKNMVTINLADIKQIHNDYNISGGAYMLLESPKDLAAEYSELCTYDESTNKFTILDMKKFGDDVIGGVPLDNVNGTYMMTCSIPFNSDNISIPSINNGCMYPAYGVPGGYILGSGKQETVISGTSGGQAIIDAISKNGIGTITSYDGKVIHIELIK